VIVSNLNVVCIACFPYETDAVLIINADAVLTFSISTEGLEVIAGRFPEISQLNGSINHRQFALGYSPYCRGKPAVFSSPPKLFSRSVRERLNHCRKLNATR